MASRKQGSFVGTLMGMGLVALMLSGCSTAEIQKKHSQILVCTQMPKYCGLTYEEAMAAQRKEYEQQVADHEAAVLAAERQQAEDNARTIMPTMVSPLLDTPEQPLFSLTRKAHNAGPPGWYWDNVTGSATEQFRSGCKFTTLHKQSLTLPELQRLQQMGRPEIMDVLDASYMTEPDSLALVARLATLHGPSDPAIKAALQDLEDKGHALSTAWHAPNARHALVDRVAYQCQREQLLATAGKGVRGDARALDDLSDLGRQLRADPLGAMALDATRALVKAQHLLRLQFNTSEQAHTSYWLVTSRTFESALMYLSAQSAMAAMPSTLGCMVVGPEGCGAQINDATHVRRTLGCFPLEAAGHWTAAEKAEHSAQCLATPQERAQRNAQRTPCANPGVMASMQTLASRGLQSKSLAGFKAVQAAANFPPMIGVQLQGAQQDQDLDQGAGRVCVGLLKVQWAPPSDACDATCRIGMHALAMATFEVRDVPATSWSVRLTHMMGTRLDPPLQGTAP